MSKLIVGYTTGVYDLFHIGHLNILRRAKSACDILIVGVSTDELVMREKNKRPVIQFDERVEIIQAIRYVDRVVPQPNKNKLEAYHELKFDKMFVGSDWEGTPQWAKIEEDFKPFPVEIIYLPHTDGISSTLLVDKIRNKQLGVGCANGSANTFPEV